MNVKSTVDGGKGERSLAQEFTSIEMMSQRQRPMKTKHGTVSIERDRLPSLKECIASIKMCGNNKSNGIRKTAELFTSCVAFMVHLDADRSHYARRGRKSCPVPAETPAIAAILGDRDLFQLFLSLLTSNIREDGELIQPSLSSGFGGSMKQNSSLGQTKLTNKHQVPHKQNSLMRKRSLSTCSDNASEPPRKTSKILLSPKVGKSDFAKVASPLANIPMPLASSHSFEHHSSPLDDIKFSVLAANIFYAALQHLDHWPSIFIRAYAEDSFGRRKWVDDERCSLFTKNLALALKSDTSPSKATHELEIAGGKFNDSFNSFFIADVDDETCTPEQPPHVPAHLEKASLLTEDEYMSLKYENLIDEDMSDSDSGEEECVLEGKSGNLQTNGESSSSGEEEIEEVVIARSEIDNDVKNFKTPPKDTKTIDNSSSSGEEEVEEEIIIAKSIDNSGKKKKFNSKSKDMSSPSSLKSLSMLGDTKMGKHWWFQEKLNLSKVRRRFFGGNKNEAYDFVGNALSSRLDERKKQNSGLLAALPSFISVPQVRSLAAGYLEKWLQSPALSGLARPLFSSLVNEISNVDPPLQHDITAINSILSMKLKANQFGVHLENVTNMVKNVPTKALSRHVILHLLREEMYNDNKNESQNLPNGSDQLRMFIAVHTSLSQSLASDAIANGILTLLSEKIEEDKASIAEVCNLLHKVVAVLRHNYDGYQTLKALIECNRNNIRYKQVINPDDVAIILFECVNLMVPEVPHTIMGINRQHIKSQSRLPATAFRGDFTGNIDESIRDEMISLRPKILASRKLLLDWCLNTYAKAIRENNLSKNTHKRQRSNASDSTSIGAGTPDYSSILDGESKICFSEPNQLMRTLRCMLFLEKPDSKELFVFLRPVLSPIMNTEDKLPREHQYRLHMCSEYGVSVDDETLWIILKAATAPKCIIDPSTALSLIEELLYHCMSERTAEIAINDSDIVWELYKLSEYHPKIPSKNVSESDLSDSTENSINLQKTELERNLSENGHNEKDLHTTSKLDIPRLAYPGLWWRATAIGLIICGKSPQTIGADMWEKHPTLKALIKMTTSGRYRFPTADCNDEERELMKQVETELRDEETKITEILFLPKSKRSPIKKKADVFPLTAKSGSRVSARQREKQAKLIALQREKEIAQVLAEEQRRKKLLRTAQKSITLWDPRAGARKPPKDSVNLIVSIDSLFNLAEAFKQCISPDFLLMTIGSTSRDGIERAYEWLIPVISSCPNLINRLPPSASCFLLLRAYGADGNENNQLLELSSPLLKHVTQCLVGEFGEEDALRAADILFLDLADQNPDRRRCARRVLQEALGKLDSMSRTNSELENGEFCWLFSLLHVKYASALILNAIPHLSNALAYERGRVLRAFLLALHEYVKHGHVTKSRGSWNFASMVCELLSSRPHVCCGAMDRFTDLRDVLIQVVYKEFEACTSISHEMNSTEDTMGVRMCLFVSSNASRGDEKDPVETEVIVPLPLLRASIVIVSNWSDSSGTDDYFEDAVTPSQAEQNSISKTYLMALVDFLVASASCENGGHDSVTGAASATFVSTGKRAVSVDQWVMLAKSRCDLIARQSALSTPDIFLPRLLLCCGLPRSSLVSMIERLGRLADASSDRDKCFSQLLTPSATSEWGIGHITKRSIITRKLLGRVSAYIDILRGSGTDGRSDLEAVASSSFVLWLTEECAVNEEKLKKIRARKSGGITSSKTKHSLPDHLKSTVSLESFITEMMEDDDSKSNENETFHWEDEGLNTNLIKLERDSNRDIMNKNVQSNIVTVEVLEELCRQNNFECLELALDHTHFNFVSYDVGIATADSVATSENILSPKKMMVVAKELLFCYFSSFNRTRAFTRIVLKWVPLYTQYYTDASFWKVIFISRNESDKVLEEVMDLLVNRCMESWSIECVVSCQSWILSTIMSKESNSISLGRFVRFMICRSGQHSVQYTSFARTLRPGSFSAVISHDHAVGTISLALECAKVWFEESKLRVFTSKELPFKKGSDKARNLLPDWLVLMLLVGKNGKKYLNLLTDMLVARLPSEGWEEQVLPGTLLRLYATFPSMMSLSNPKTRMILVDASRVMSSEWLEWRTPLDEQLDDAIFNLSLNPTQRQQQLVSDISKRYPLIVMRQLFKMIDILKKDGDFVPRHAEKRGRVHGTSRDNVALAQKEFVTCKVFVVQWGDSFTEPLWVAVLDILCSLPGEVIFVCGGEMGLFELLNLYLSLIVMQYDVGGITNTTRIRTKLSALVTIFSKTNRSACDHWMQSRLHGLQSRGIIRNMLAAYDIWNIKATPDPKSA